jgi:hypothetical protein
MIRNLTLLVPLLAVFALGLGCEEEEKDYDCDEAFDAMYDEDCELWCAHDSDGVYMDTCGWYDDNDPANFPESSAKDFCEDVEDFAEDEHCKGEFQDMLNCLHEKAYDNCAENCEDAYDDLLDCLL